MMIEVTTTGQVTNYDRHPNIDVVRIDDSGHLKLERQNRLVAVYAPGKWIKAVERVEEAPA